MPDVLLSRASICFLAAGAAGTSETSGLKAPSIHLHMQQQQPSLAAGLQPKLLRCIGTSASLTCPGNQDEVPSIAAAGANAGANAARTFLSQPNWQ
jgi:hypothetical protein